MGYVKKKEGSDHARQTQMIETFSGLVSCLPMLMESMRGRGFFTSRKEILKERDDIQIKKMVRWLLIVWFSFSR